MLRLLTVPNSTGAAFGGWRHPGGWPDNMVMNLSQSIAIAKTAERGKFDGLFLADGNGVRQLDRPELFKALKESDRPAVFEPVTLYAALSQHTEHLGFVATATTTFEEPFHLARKFASLDHLSGGRASWNIVTTGTPSDATNFGLDELPSRAVRMPRADEFVEVVKGLWDSWADDAFIQDRETGQFLDPDRVRVLNHEGQYFKVKGPLNVARTPQGRPVTFTAGQSDAGRELAAKHADCIFAVAMSKAAGVAFMQDVKGRLAKYGRAPGSLKIFCTTTFYVGRTSEEAEDLFQQIGDLILPSLGVDYLEEMLKISLKDYDIDGPVPDIDPTETNGLNTERVGFAKLIKDNNLTIRQAYQRIAASAHAPIMKGSPTQIADQMEDWYRSGACDGFMVATPYSPKVFDDFVDLVVPELQRRGLFRTQYTGRTFRENLGLATPTNPFFSKEPA